MSDEKEPYENHSPTPVVDATKTKVWRSRLLVISVVLVVVGGMLAQHLVKANNEPQEEIRPVTATVMAPQLTPVEQEMNQVTTALEKQEQKQEPRNDDIDEADKLERMRMVASTTVYSTSSNPTSTSQGTLKEGGSNAVLGGNGTGDQNTQFMSHVSDSGVPIANATRMAHPNTTLAQGTMIWATLESRLVSDLPGMIRAVTSEDIYSEDGSQVMLPKGSRLVGQYTNAISQGQERIFVIWQRVIRPDHISVQLNSTGTDTLGAAGIAADSINHHFFDQFGNSILLSIIGAGAANLNVGTQDQFNSASAYREAIANSFSQTAENTLKSTGVIQPTLYKNQGAAISVFVARDLDFYNELGTRDSQS